jgi:large conductance mechanosensitive channel
LHALPWRAILQRLRQWESNFKEKSMLNEFKKFAMRGNVIDMAVGIIIGASFGTIVKSLVDDIIMPPIGLVLGNVDFSDLFLVLKQGTVAGPYVTVEAAQKAGAVTLNYGAFINNVVTFLIVAFAVFLLVRTINRMKEAPVPPPPAATPEDVLLLREIRDSLKK